MATKRLSRVFVFVFVFFFFKIPEKEWLLACQMLHGQMEPTARNPLVANGFILVSDPEIIGFITVLITHCCIGFFHHLNPQGTFGVGIPL